MAKILIVDDDRTSLEVLNSVLSSAQHHVLALHNGQDAISAARREKPDLIVLDLIMPEMSGAEVIEVLKADPELQDIPILLISGICDDTSEEATVNVLGEQYPAIAKPFNADQLLNRVNAVLK